MADVQQLMAQLNDRATYEQAANALVSLGSEAVAPLIERLHSPNQSDRTLAVRLLGRIDDPRVIPALMEHSTRDPVPVVRDTVITTLAGFQSDPRIIEFLLQSARNTAQQDIARMAAIRQIGKLSGQEAANALWLEMLDDPSATMMINAAHNLGTTKKPEFFEPLLTTLNRLDENAQGLAGVIQGLGQLGDKRAYEPLVERLKSARVNVRSAAIHALTTLNDVRALEMLAPLQNDRTVSGQEDHGGPTYTIGSEAAYAIATLRKANGMAAPQSEAKKPWWKVW